jgi:prevent-host-death family protein
VAWLPQALNAISRRALANVLHCRTVDKDRVGLRELGQNVSRVMERIKKGESLVVTEHGTPIARLEPYKARSRLEDMIAEGDAIPAEITIQEFLATHVPIESEIRGSEILQQMRDEERF